MKLYVVRHGQTEINVKGQINGHNDIGLNEKGIKQAKEAGKKVKDLKIDLVFCSPIKRTRETCMNVNVNQIEVIYDKRLVERDSRSMEFKPISVIDWDTWYDREREVVFTDTEGFKCVLARVTSFIEEMKRKYKDKNILVVTHGDVCKAFYVYFNPNILDTNIVDYEQPNCGIAEYEC